jgi:D-glycero-alpha-D-manno-heptose 1-phosphate guanylyltransferase
MKVIILCEGLGTRLKSIISEKPKPLAPIAGRPFLEHIIKWLARYDLKEVIFCVSYKAGQIIEFIGSGEKLGIQATYAKRSQPSGTGGAIKYANKYVKKGEEALILNGDTLFDINLEKFRDFHRHNNSYITIALSHVLDVSRYGEVKLDSN